ncbi:hypothetical protein AURDEDRAFT_155110 [Auricularia subglabra TFB-10046 SS5]|uniref:Uncharacterized protein n=1 Tax=Auricularia subglabra (strain TFB-10046 / SS5) TaxID=717982 RepID=J0LA92_AURST|nr:hypothetical protein AURDEDRAFT_155110 [Auricularia subglabra TFB-10046 SS5]
MPKANKKARTSSATSTVNKSARAGGELAIQPALPVHLPVRTLRARPAAKTSTTPAPTKQPRKCRVCGRPRLGHPRQCTAGPSLGSRRDELEDAAAQREAQCIAEEVLFLLRAALVPEQDKMQLDDSRTDAAHSHSSPLSPPPGTPPRVSPGDDLKDDDSVAPPVDDSVAPPVDDSVAPPVDDSVAPPVDGPVGPPVDVPEKAPAGKKQKKARKPTDDDGDAEPGDEPLEGGLKSTPKGDVPMPLKRSAKSKDTYDARSASKKTTEMFQSIAMQGDLLASRVPGWAFLIFVPMHRRGEMRSWTSPQVRNDVPDLPGELRKIIFDRLEPFREQADEEREMILVEKENLLKEKDSQLERYKRIAEEAERRAQEKEREADALRSAYSGASKIISQ